MWYIYSSGKDKHYLLEVGYRAIDSGEISHNYELVRGWCQEGCDSYGSGGCAPWAPPFSALKLDYPYGVLIFARFFTRYLPPLYARCQIPYVQYRFPDIILTTLFTRLGYQVLDSISGDILFLNSGHCMGCGLATCNYLRGYPYCINPGRRTYAIGATGIEAAKLLQEAFGIKLQWYRGEDQVDSMSKVMGLFCQQRQVQNQILEQMLINLNALNCTHFPIPGQHYQLMVKSLISS